MKASRVPQSPPSAPARGRGKTIKSTRVKSPTRRASPNKAPSGRLPRVTIKQDPHVGVPFGTVEEAWFWFITARQAWLDGARGTTGPGCVARPCEPVDILNILSRLHRRRLLTMEHLRVLKFYGDRHMPPDPDRPRERWAAQFWADAMRRLQPIFARRGIIDARYTHLGSSGVRHAV